SVHADVWHVVKGEPRAVRLFGAGLFGPKSAVPGTDLAGTVTQVGAAVTRFAVGDEVFGESHKGLQWTNGGAFAEFAAVPESALSHKPACVSFEAAAAVPTSGFIALTNLDFERYGAEHRMIVNGAAGGVGSLVVQIGKARGMHVTAVDRAETFELLRALGADCQIDYQQQDFTQGSARYDVIYDVASTLTLDNYQRALAPQGKYVRVGHEHYGQRGSKTWGSLPEFFKFVALSAFRKDLPSMGFSLPPKHEIMTQLAALLEAGLVTPHIGRRFPLQQAAQALRELEQGRVIGKIMLCPQVT
ncbi:MAG TPA: NAD(P)-dependent alcohol dehydrogenase, partial [Polyangiaceae bacterium]|nr:NAD(P)-dependent alcohol dehydrogenase [Polyangiaceae bacterium]